MPDIEKPSSQEEEYFAREEIEKKRKLALRQSEELAARQKEELKKLHHMKCPKCGMDLQTIERAKVQVDTCFNCQGLWLDAGELERIVETGLDQKGKVMGAVLNIFKKK